MPPKTPARATSALARRWVARAGSLAAWAVVVGVAASASWPLAAQAHGGHDEPDEEEGGGGDMGMKMSPRPGSNGSDAAAKEQALVALHALIASVVAWVTMPVAVGMVAGRMPDPHKVLSAANWGALLFAGLIAALGFADGESSHAMLGVFCLVCWTAQATYGIVRHFFYRTSMSITPHRGFGIFLFGLTVLTWVTGVMHIQGSCNATADLQICNAHFVLGGFFALVGFIHLYVGLEGASRMEILLIGLGAVSELVGEGLGDLVLYAINPTKYPWNYVAKQQHLGAAALWLLGSLVAYVLVRRRPEALTRGYALILGLIPHLIFMFMHQAHDPTVQAMHTAHSLCLLPVLVLRPAKFQLPTFVLLVLAGFFFAAAADPVVRDALHAGSGLQTASYVVVVFFFALAVILVHVYIFARIVNKPQREPYEDTMWDRALITQCLSRACCCLPCVPFLLNAHAAAGPQYTNIEIGKVSKGDEAGLDEDDDEDDVTQAPKP